MRKMLAVLTAMAIMTAPAWAETSKMKTKEEGPDEAAQLRGKIMARLEDLEEKVRIASDEYRANTMMIRERTQRNEDIHEGFMAATGAIEALKEFVKEEEPAK